MAETAFAADTNAATEDLPLSPDFALHPVTLAITRLDAEPESLTVTWADGLTARFNCYWLRENEVGNGVINPVTRERDLDIVDMPDNLAIGDAGIESSGAVTVRWLPDGRETRHHPGWLRTTAEHRYRADAAIPARESWDAATMAEPVSFDGPPVLEDDAALHAWLTATHRYGLSRLRGLPDEAGLVGRIAERIGVIRSSNFGFLFTVESKPNPDSNAYTSAALAGHTDLPTRETQPGLQLLYCRENTCRDGHSIMVDGFRIAETIRDTDAEAFDALTTLNWIMSNRHRDSDYRWSDPIVILDRAGGIAEIKYANFLRAEPDMPERDVPRAYRALRLFARLSRDPAYVCRYPFAAGDLVIFDNRRILHGRDSFSPNSGTRRLEGCYLDRDELFSRLRVLAREKRAGLTPPRG